MLVYNVTVKVSWAIEEGWLEWMQQQHMPDVLATGQFDTAHIYRLLDQDETEGPTFVAQYQTSSPERLEKYLADFAPLLQQDGRNKWGDQYIAFRSVMSRL